MLSWSKKKKIIVVHQVDVNGKNYFVEEMYFTQMLPFFHLNEEQKTDLGKEVGGGCYRAKSYLYL